MTGLILSPPFGWNVPTMFVFLIVVSSCAIGGSSPVSAESVECVHGWQKDGTCFCHNCWTGPLCDKDANNYRPFFLRKAEEVTLEPLSEDDMDTVFFTADAVDADESQDCPTPGKPCPCGEIRYTIASGNNDGYFSIDTSSGKVSVSKDLLNSVAPVQDVYTLVIHAYNPETPDMYDEMSLTVSLGARDHMLPPRVIANGQGDSFGASAHHHVHKRAAITLPNNASFTFTKTGNSENVTEMRVGTRVSFQLQILFPLTTTDMLVELFAPDNDSIVMMLCDVQIASIGSNLAHDGPAQIVMDSQNASSKFFDRAIIDFGNVSNSFTDTTTEAASSVFIVWDAVMIQNDNTVDQANYWVSAGAEFNDEMEVWIGQAGFTAVTGAEVDNFPTSTFNMTGPNSMSVGSSAVFRLDMFITKPSVALSVDAFAPLNNTDVMSVCGMKIVDTGDNYNCGFIPGEVVATFHADSNTRGNGRARLDAGVVTNKGARESNNPSEMNRISVEFVVHLYEDVSYVGQSYWVGAAVEMGSDQIWAGQILVTVTAFTPTPSISPSWEITKEGSGKVSSTSPLLMTLDVTIPQNTVGRYALEILSPVNDSAAVLQLCAVRILSVGDNLKCTETAVTPSYTSRGSPLFIDRAYVDLGIISNVGDWGPQPFNASDLNSTVPDQLRVQFLVKTTNHTLATVGSQHGINMGLIINDNRLLVGLFQVEIEAPVDPPNITTEMTPDWDIAWLSGVGNVRIGGAGQLLVTVTTKRGVIYSPFDLEVLMPNSTGVPEVSVCKVQVHSVGANLPCVMAAAINASFAFTSMSNDTSLSGDVRYDRAVLNLDTLCNVESQNDTEQDKLVLKVGFMLHDDAGLVNGTELLPSVGVMFSPYKMWVGQIKTWARDDITNSATAPHVAITKVSADVPVGYVAIYHVLVKTVPTDVWPYSLNVSVSTPGLSVCSVKLIQVGDNMPCTDESKIGAVYERDLEGTTNLAHLNLGSVSNVGSGAVAADTTFDDNSLLVEVVVGVSLDTTLIADGSTHTFDVLVTYGTTSDPHTSPSFTAIHDQSSINTTASSVSKVQLNVVPVTDTDNGTDVVLGQSKRVQMCMWTHPGLLTRLSVKMLTPIDTYGVLEAVFVGVTQSGANMPCAGSCNTGLITYESRTGSSYIDIATVDLGYVYNNNFDTVDPDANKVCVDGVFRVQKNDTLTPGDTVKVSASLNINDVEITVIQQSLTIVDNTTFTDTYPANLTLSSEGLVSVHSSVGSVCLTPGDLQTLPIVIRVPGHVTTHLTFDVKMDVNTSACMTYRDMRLISVGENLRGLGKEGDLQCTANSTMGTTQMDSVYCSLGVVTNPGMSHRCSTPGTDDDSIYLELDLQMADCPLAAHDTNLTASMGVKEAGFIEILNYPITVCRLGPETPVYNITAFANSTGDVMFIDYEIRLDNTSQAEVHNTSLVVTPPAYVTCNTLHSSSGTNMVPVLDTSSSSRLVIEFGSLYFTDVVELLVQCSATSGYVVPSGISGHYTVVTHQLSGDVIPRAISTLPSSTVWSDLAFVNFTATTVSDSGVSCTSAALGVADNSIVFDCQISSSPASLTPATDGRKGGTGWQPYVHEDGDLKGQRYFQVYFPNKVLVDSVEVNNLNTAKATQIKLAYSMDGKAFLDGDTITLAGLTAETVTVPNPQVTQVLRVYVINSDVTDQPVSLTFEFFGCATSTGGPAGSTAICNAANAAIPPEVLDILFYRRSILAHSNGAVFVCDGKVENQKTVQRCYKSTDGATWQALDPRVACMVGHEPDSDRVFAVASDGVTYMSSGDQGQTWATTHGQALSEAQTQLLYVPAKNVPWTHATELTRGTPKTEYQSGVWGADFDYLKKNEGGTWNNKMKWNCC